MRLAQNKHSQEQKPGLGPSSIHSFEELRQLEALAERGSPWFELKEEAKVYRNDLSFPIYSLQNREQQPNTPLLFLVGGIHGVERIGTQTLQAFLNTVIEQLHWNDQLNTVLKRVKLVCIPIANPIGMYRKTRSNGSGVDLMRNSPIESLETSNPFVSGQSFTPNLPWYRGGSEFEPETQVIFDVLERSVQHSKFILSLDYHSGFGFRDRIWFPYAYRKRLMTKIESIVALKLLWDRTYPNHPYLIEPQSMQYLTHGDLWDYFYKLFGHKSGRTFIPLTLEMGSWIWLKKRPVQLFKFEGFF